MNKEVYDTDLAEAIQTFNKADKDKRIVIEKDGKIFINGKETTTYTFQMNYYWMMGDNRHNSADSRYFGFVPDDHIVGKAWFVWLSFGNKGIRWNRLFRSIAHLEQ